MLKNQKYKNNTNTTRPVKPPVESQKFFKRTFIPRNDLLIKEKLFERNFFRKTYLKTNTFF